MSFKLTVVVPTREVFDSYWYGSGVEVSDEPDPLDSPLHPPTYRKIVIDYGDDFYRADYQAGRFASGLYFAKVEEV